MLGQNVGKCVVNFKTGWRQNFNQIDCAISQPRAGVIRVEGNLKSTTGANLEYYMEFTKRGRNLSATIQLKDNAKKNTTSFNLLPSNSEIGFTPKAGANNPFDLRIRTKIKIGTGTNSLEPGSMIFVDGKYAGQPL